jgi:hypothetical protein
VRERASAAHVGDTSVHVGACRCVASHVAARRRARIAALLDATAAAPEAP